MLISGKEQQELASKADLIVLEDLNISGMKKRCKPKEDAQNEGHYLSNGQSRKVGLNRSISDCAWYSLSQKIEYVAAKHGKMFLKVNPLYTSQTCPECGHVHKDNRKGEKFICTECGFMEHADINAACNIRNKGLNEIGIILEEELKEKKVLGDSQEPEVAKLASLTWYFQTPKRNIPESTGTQGDNPQIKLEEPGNLESETQSEVPRGNRFKKHLR